MENWIKWTLGIIGGGSVALGTIVLLLFLIGSPDQAQEVREIPGELEDTIDETADEVAATGKSVLGQINEDRKKAVQNEEDPNVKGLLNVVYLYVMGIVIYVFVVLILAIVGLKDKIQF